MRKSRYRFRTGWWIGLIGQSWQLQVLIWCRRHRRLKGF